MDFLKRKFSAHGRKRSNTVPVSSSSSSSTSSSSQTKHPSSDHDRPEDRALTPAEKHLEANATQRYESHLRQSNADPSSTTTAPPKRSKSLLHRQKPTRAPASFVKYGGPGLNAPGNVRGLAANDDDGSGGAGRQAFGSRFDVESVPPLPPHAHVHGDGATLGDFERFKLRATTTTRARAGTAQSVGGNEAR